MAAMAAVLAEWTQMVETHPKAASPMTEEVAVAAMAEVAQETAATRLRTVAERGLPLWSVMPAEARLAAPDKWPPRHSVTVCVYVMGSLPALP